MDFNFPGDALLMNELLLHFSSFDGGFAYPIPQNERFKELPPNQDEEEEVNLVEDVEDDFYGTSISASFATEESQTEVSPEPPIEAPIPRRTRRDKNPRLVAPNRHGRTGYRKCFNCRKSKLRCNYDDEDAPCRRCQIHRLNCGEKSLAQRAAAFEAKSNELSKREPSLSPNDVNYTKSENAYLHKFFDVYVRYGSRYDFGFHFQWEPRSRLRDVRPLADTAAYSQAVRYAALTQCSYLCLFNSSTDKKVRWEYYGRAIRALRKAISEDKIEVKIEVAYSCMLLSQLLTFRGDQEETLRQGQEEWLPHVFGMWEAVGLLMKTTSRLSEVQLWSLEVECLQLISFLSSGCRGSSHRRNMGNQISAKASSLLLTLSGRPFYRSFAPEHAELVLNRRLAAAAKVYFSDQVGFSKDIVFAQLVTIEQQLQSLRSSLSLFTDIDVVLATLDDLDTPPSEMSLRIFSLSELEDIGVYVRLKISRFILDSWFQERNWDDLTTLCMHLIRVSSTRLYLLLDSEARVRMKGVESSIMDFFLARLFLTGERESKSPGYQVNQGPVTWIKNQIAGLLTSDCMKLSRLRHSFPDSYDLWDLADSLEPAVVRLMEEYRLQSVWAWFLRIRYMHKDSAMVHDRDVFAFRHL